MRTIATHSPEETIELGARLAAELLAGDLIALIGELGAGKTMFTKGIAKGLGVGEYEYVNSPSFVVMKEYPGKKPLYHFDIYRLDEKRFCETLDYEEDFYGDGITVVEWADKVEDILPEEYLEVKISHGGKDSRKFEFVPHGEKFKRIAGNIVR
jgi:tRNA threonylcarbamoyladenosine biosynthesis protein TsaE